MIFIARHVICNIFYSWWLITLVLGRDIPTVLIVFLFYDQIVHQHKVSKSFLRTFPNKTNKTCNSIKHFIRKSQLNRNLQAFSLLYLFGITSKQPPILVYIVGLHSPVKIFSIRPFFVSPIIYHSKQNNPIASLLYVTLNVVNIESRHLPSIVYKIHQHEGRGDASGLSFRMKLMLILLLIPLCGHVIVINNIFFP